MLNVFSMKFKHPFIDSCYFTLIFEFMSLLKVIKDNFCARMPYWRMTFNLVFIFFDFLISISLLCVLIVSNIHLTDLRLNKCSRCIKIEMSHFIFAFILFLTVF